MIDRRNFVKILLISGASLLNRPLPGKTLDQSKKRTNPIAYRLTRDVPTKLFDGEKCWTHPRAGLVPGAGSIGISRARLPRVVMTMNTLDLSGSDVFKGMFDMRTDDLGKSWTKPRQIAHLSPRYETISGTKCPVAVSDFWPGFHAATQTLLGTGHTVVYTPDWEARNPRPRHTAYSVYNPDKNQWAAWQKLNMPDGEKFQNAGAGCVQRYDEADGTILLPIYFLPPGKNSQVTVVRCSFDGNTLQYQEHGNELSIDNETRGLHEPSITRFDGNYFLTIRNDQQGFVTRSQDGLHFDPIKPWTFDDDTPLGNYNTQQHWVTHSAGLFLVYTRRGANNDHVFRHRAPLFMAQVDAERLCVLRKTEQILVPERGARLGNFGVTEVSENETWVTVSEWMQPEGVAQYGSDGSVYVARIHWSQPNRNFT